MRQRSLLLVTALLFSLSVHAQRKRNLSAGPLIGVNVSNIHGDIGNNTSKAGLLVGGFLNYSIKETFGVSAQLTYSQLGANFNTAQPYAGKLKLDYLQIPALAVFYFGRGLRPGTVRPKLFLGPHVGFLLGAKDKNGNKVNDINSFDFGATFGGGLNFALQNQRWINLDLRYGLGLTDIHKPDNLVWKNGAFSATLGISFPLGNYDNRAGTVRP